MKKINIDYDDVVLAFAFALAQPAIHPDFANLPIIMGTGGDMEIGEEADKWFYKIPYNDNE